VSYGYDQLDRRTSETFGSSYTATYSYDLADQLTQASDGVATYGYAYDKLGRATTVTNTLAGSGVPGLVTFTQGFDLNGNRTLLSASIGGTMSAGADFVNQYAFDGLNRLTRVTQAGQTGGHAVREKRVDFSYTADSQWGGITRYQDLAGTKLVAASTFGYDQAGRLQQLTHTQNATTLAGFSWTYDTLNRVKTFTDTLHAAESATYAYDDADQLTGADRTGTSNDETYSYDANGNRSNYTTGLDNRLQSDGTYTYQYDNEGNRTRRTKTSGGSYTEYAWDHRNRLTSVTDKTASGAVTRQAFYTYDVFDRRVAKQVDWDGAGAQVASKEYYFYDGQHIALKFVDPDASGAQPSALRSRLLHGQAVDQILADEAVTSLTAPGNVLWPLTDNLGTVRDIVDFNETTNISQVVNHLAYDAFGRITSETNAAVDFLMAYAGLERDEETGFYHSQTRYYDPLTGRWTQEDWISFRGGDTNLYRYVANAPTRATDHTGMSEDWWESSGWWWLNPWSYNVPVGQRGILNWATGNYTAERRGADIEHAAREYNREASIADPKFDPNRWQGTYRLGRCESRIATRTAETGLEVEAAILGGAGLRASRTSGGSQSSTAGPARTTRGGKGTSTAAKTGAKQAAQSAAAARSIVRDCLPKLHRTFTSAFEGQVRFRTFRAGERVYRSPWSPNELPDKPGSWFGTRKTATQAGTDSTYQITKWGNPNQVLREYEFTQDVTVYYGEVRGGTGYQLLIPLDVSPEDVLKFVGEEPLK
jgi:RHS repeat-associated protein